MVFHDDCDDDDYQDDILMRTKIFVDWWQYNNIYGIVCSLVCSIGNGNVKIGCMIWDNETTIT